MTYDDYLRQAGLQRLQQMPYIPPHTIGSFFGYGAGMQEAALQGLLGGDISNTHGSCQRRIEQLENELESIKRITFCAPSNRSFLINHVDWWRGLRWGMLAGASIAGAVAYWLS